MRKLSLLLVALLVVSTGAFAQVTITPEIEVEASATWGINLDEETHGLKNDASATLSFTFLEESTEEFGTGEVYGWIELDGFEISFEVDGDADGTTDGAPHFFVETGEISARLYLMGPMVYIDILSAPGGINEADDLTLIGQTILGFGSMVGTEVPPTHTGKVALGVALPDLVEMEFGLLAPHWDDNSIDGSDNWYMLTFDAEVVAVPDFSIVFNASMHVNDDDTGLDAGEAGFGIGVEYSMPLTPDIDLIPALGFDYVAYNEDHYAIEFGFALNFSWAGLGTDDDGETLFGQDADVTSGFSVGVLYGMGDDDTVGGIGDYSWLMLKAGLFEDSGDDGLLPVIGAALLFEYFMDLENDFVDMAFGLEVNADLGVVEPFFGLTYVMEDVTDEIETLSFMYLNVGTDINVIDNTTFTIAYESGELLQELDNPEGNVLYGDDYFESARESGQLWIRTKISF